MGSLGWGAHTPTVADSGRSCRGLSLPIDTSRSAFTSIIILAFALIVAKITFENRPRVCYLACYRYTGIPGV